MAENYVCPNEECSNPIDLDTLNRLPDDKLVLCPNCLEVKFFKSAKGELECDWYDKRVDAEFKIDMSEIPSKDDIDEESDVESEDESDDEDEAEEMSEVDKALAPPSDVKAATTKSKKKKKKRKKKKKAYPHIQLVQEYLDYFIEHPEGVEISDLVKVFGVDVQQAHYIQRKTFKLAKENGYEVVKKRIKGQAKVLMVIRSKDC